jgi:hypothetical protein
MKLAVSFIFFKAKPSCFIVDLTREQWFEFYQLESKYERKVWMIHFLCKRYLSVANELCWIPLDFQSKLSVNDGVEVFSRDDW